ncbi:MAG: hypothetical protein Q4B26_14235 [Eubacteriales bacterium]|nr:hypothetical protein [Eubacteriales bacterium]
MSNDNKIKDQFVLYDSEELYMTKFSSDGRFRPGLYIVNARQRNLPKMKFVGGHPDEWCIFLDELTKDELAMIKTLDGQQLNVECLLEKEKENEV